MPVSPITVVENTENGKLTDKNKNYNAITTYQQVGPTCPTSCWFHPESQHKDERIAAGLKPCYTLGYTVRRHVSAAKFAGAEYTAEELLLIRRNFGLKFLMHSAGRKAIDGIRWSTGGDILNPDTGEVWHEFVDLILDVNEMALSLGIPTFGFTAAWRMPGADRLRGHFHASCQSRQDVLDAAAAGWTFAYAIPKERLHQELAWLAENGLTAVACTEQTGKSSCCLSCGICFRHNTAIHQNHPLVDDYMKYRKRVKKIDIPFNLILFSH
jgi:hypothetical protein